jgi:hypothetical protein
MLTTLIATLVRLVAPKAPKWVAVTVAALIPAIVELVTQVSRSDKEGQKATAIVAAQALLDEAFDDIPGWSRMAEHDRDAIIFGLARLAAFLSDTEITKKAARKAVRKAKRSLK